jgi:hypothetical protein
LVEVASGVFERDDPAGGLEAAKPRANVALRNAGLLRQSLYRGPPCSHRVAGESSSSEGSDEVRLEVVEVSSVAVQEREEESRCRR